MARRSIRRAIDRGWKRNRNRERNIPSRIDAISPWRSCGIEVRDIVGKSKETEDGIGVISPALAPAAA